MTAVAGIISTQAFVPIKIKRHIQWNGINGYRSPSPEPRPKKRRIETSTFQKEVVDASNSINAKQKVLLLHGPKQRYSLENGRPVPEVREDHELLIKIEYIGLNPIDWKAPDFGFGIPTLPYIAGRDFVGIVVSEPRAKSRVRIGDVVFSASTDYRDLRKAAYQQFAVASDFNVCRVPSSVPRESVAGLGVAFVAAALALGVCLGCDFSDVGFPGGPNLRHILRSIQSEIISEDVRRECLENIRSSEIPRKGDWILIWGGSSASARILSQLSKLIGLRVIKVVDVAKHGERLSKGNADLLVDNHDPKRAIEVIQKVTNGTLRFAVDTVGKQTAELAQVTLQQSESGPGSHLVGLTGLPKEKAPGVKFHTVPIKIHHEIREIGDGLMTWLEVLLRESMIVPPDSELAPGGMEGTNEALDRMRSGQISGKRLVVKLES